MSRITSFIPPLQDALLQEHNFFELYPFDGGGCFVHQDLLGTTGDALAAGKLLQGGALDDFGGIDDIDFLKFERWSTIEKSCWINRMYFIVHLARQYRLTKDEAIAGRIVAILRRFMEKYPGPATQTEAMDLDARILFDRNHNYNSSTDFDGPTEYQWFDFQPASRLIHIACTAYFLKGSRAFSEGFALQLDELLRTHARCICWVEAFGKELTTSNHQALRGLALLYAATIFKGEAEACEWRKLAEKLCNYHILNDFLPDGMLVDLSPSYHFFECWISRDALLLADREGYHLTSPARQRLEKAFELCRILRQPDGFSPVLNDGYALDLEVFLKSLPPVSSDPPDAVVLPYAGIAIWHTGKIFVLLDDSPLTGPFAHYHAGKQAITLFLNGKPFLADSGCCNYDDPDFAQWYKQPVAHSTLLLNGHGDSIIEGRYHWLVTPECSINEWLDGKLISTLTSKAPGWENTTWKRTLNVHGTTLVIEDDIQRKEIAVAQLVFNFHPEVMIELQAGKALLTHENVTAEMQYSAAAELRQAKGFLAFQKCPDTQLILCKKGASLQFRTTFKLA